MPSDKPRRPLLYKPPLVIVALTVAAAGLGPGACGPVAGGRTLTTEGDVPGRLTSLTTLDQRVARVAQRLSEANANLCPVIRQSAGWALHAASQYSQEMRPHAEARFGLDGDLPGVLAAPPGSAAASAGVREGDLILAVNAETLNRGPDREEPIFEGLAANIATLDRALSRGSTTITVRRGAETPTLTIRPRRACGYEVQLDPSDELNARADGRRLFISTALAGFAQNDDELSIILGHELAHHVLGHRPWTDGGDGARQANESVRRTDGGSGGAEQQADRVGLYLAARAGYDPAVAAPFWRRFGQANWRVRFPQIAHASAGARAAALEVVQREIEAKQRTGGELLP